MMNKKAAIFGPLPERDLYTSQFRTCGSELLYGARCVNGFRDELGRSES